MVKYDIKYKDFNDMDRAEVAYFHLTEAEIVEMMYDKSTLLDQIEEITKNNDMDKIIKVIKNLILKAYGHKSEDGLYFVKVDEEGHKLANKFVQSGAYSALFMELARDDQKAADFIKRVLPKELSDSAKKQIEDAKESK